MSERFLWGFLLGYGLATIWWIGLWAITEWLDVL
jgi:hypothetical protein